MARVTNDEINAFKSEIPLAEYIQHFDANYKIQHSKSNAHTTYLNNKITGSKIAVSKINGQHVFKDWKAPVNVKGSGSIIDFVQQYKNKSYTETLFHLRDESKGIQPKKLPYNQIANKIEEKTVKVSEDHFKYEKLKHTKYLNDRGIDTDTINSPTFIGRVGQKRIQSENGGYYYSTVFPMYDNVSGELTGLEQKNHAFTGSYPGSNKKTGFFKSNVLSNNPNLFLAENPIDQMAHYQMKNPGNEQNFLYVGTFGELSEDRIQSLNEYIKSRENKFGDKFVLGMDNDAAGIRFNINLMGNVDFKQTNKEVRFFMRADKEIAKMSIISKDQNLLQDIEKNAFDIANKQLKLTSNYELQYRTFITSKNGDNYKMSFLMNNKKSNLLPLENLLNEYRNSRFEIERPIEKDFGIDLEKSKGIVRDKEAVFSYPNGTKGYVLDADQNPLKIEVKVDKTNQVYTLFAREDYELGNPLNKLKFSGSELKQLSDKGRIEIKPFFKSVWKSKGNNFRSMAHGIER